MLFATIGNENELDSGLEPGIDSSTGGSAMIFQLMGVNHRSAPLEVRERFATIGVAQLSDAGGGYGRVLPLPLAARTPTTWVCGPA